MGLPELMRIGGRMRDGGRLFFHSPCFDGIVSAVLARDFLVEKRGWADLSLRPVNYASRDEWLPSDLGTPAAVVDFLYHPDAGFWADHHPTTFLTPESERDFRRRRNPLLVYDPDAPSCARLLWEHLHREFGHRTHDHRPLVGWADTIDAARYASVEEALFGEAPALRIDRSLIGADDDYCVRLVEALAREGLHDVADLPEVRRRAEAARRRIAEGLRRFEAAARLEPDGIVVFDVASDGALVHRYAPYRFFPDARYSVGIVRKPESARITAMRNPWRDFEPVPLGEIFESLGGGGHSRVGTVRLPEDGAADACALLRRVLGEIRDRERARVEA